MRERYEISNVSIHWLRSEQTIIWFWQFKVISCERLTITPALEGKLKKNYYLLEKVKEIAIDGLDQNGLTRFWHWNTTLSWFSLIFALEEKVLRGLTFFYYNLIYLLWYQYIEKKWNILHYNSGKKWRWKRCWPKMNLFAVPTGHHPWQRG